MSFVAPWALWLAVAGVAAVVALHLIVHRRRAAPLPTVRFLPDTPAGARVRTLRRRPADPMLLALRVVALVLLGAAFALPLLEPTRSAEARVVVLDISRAVADAGEARAAAGRWLREGDVLVVFDSSARVVAPPAADSLAALGVADAPGSLSAALLAAVREGAALRERADAVEVVLVSPFVAEAWDEATPRIRRSWPGALRLERTRAASAPAPGAPTIDAALDADDPLLAALPAEAAEDGGTARVEVRLVRDEPGRDDLAWADERGRVLVHWPAAHDEAGPATGSDSVGAVVAGDEVVVAPFRRGEEPPPGRVVARWADGRPAATERLQGGGCVRSVMVPLDAAGDMVLRESTRRFVAAMLGPCGAAPDLAPLDTARVALLAGTGEARAVAASAVPALPAASRGLAAWLLGAALLLLLAELPLRRGRGHA